MSEYIDLEADFPRIVKSLIQVCESRGLAVTYYNISRVKADIYPFYIPVLYIKRGIDRHTNGDSIYRRIILLFRLIFCE